MKKEKTKVKNKEATEKALNKTEVSIHQEENAQTIIEREIAKKKVQFSDFLQYVISVYGIDIYRNRKKLETLVRDFYMGEERMKRVYIRAIADDVIAEKMYKIFNKTQEERENYYNKMISYFSEFNFCRKDVSKQIVDSFAVGMSLNIKDKDIEWLWKEAV